MWMEKTQTNKTIKKKINPLIKYLSLPFTLLYTCFMNSFLIFKSQLKVIKKKSQPNKKYHRITFNTTNSNEMAKLHMNSAKTNRKSEGNNDLFSPNADGNGKNGQIINKNDTIISIKNEENNHNCYQKVLNNIGKTSNARKHIIFQKIVFGNNSVMRKKAVMPGTDLSLNKYTEANKKFIDELKTDELLIKSKELEETLMDRLHQPIVLRNKRILLKSRPKKKVFIPSNLTTIYEDLDYC